MSKQSISFIAAIGLLLAAFAVAYRMETTVEKYHDDVDRLEAITTYGEETVEPDLFRISISGDPLFRLPAKPEASDRSKNQVRATKSPSERNK